MSGNTIVKNTTITYISMFINFIIGFIFAILIARLLGPYQYGLLSISRSIVGIIAPIALLGLSTSLVRYIPSIRIASTEKLNQYIITAFAVSIVSVVSATFLWLLLSDYVATVIFHDVNLVLIFKVIAVLIILSALSALITDTLRGFEEFKMYNFLSVSMATMALFFSLVLVYLLGFEALFVICGSIISIFITVLYGLFFVKRKLSISFSKSQFEKEIAKKLLKYGLPLVPGSFFLILMTSIDKFAIGSLMNVTNVGYYSIASGIALMAVSLAEPLGVVFFPTFSRLLATNKKEQTSGYLHILLSLVVYVMVPLSIGIILFATPIIKILFGVVYEPAIYPLMILMFGTAFYATYIVFRGYIATVFNTTIFIKMLGISGIINIILNFSLIPLYGLIGAAFATAFAFFILGIITIYCVNKSNKFEIRRLELKKMGYVLVFLIPLMYMLRGTISSLLTLAGFGLLIVLIYLLLLWVLKVKWFRELLKSFGVLK
jgi:O-antigen/teichoic acid export membrane protein